MSRSIKFLTVLALVASLVLTLLPAVANTYDFYNDFSTTTNPPAGGVWTYGYDATTGYTGFTAFSALSSPSPVNIWNSWDGNTGGLGTSIYNGASIIRNTGAGAYGVDPGKGIEFQTQSGQYYVIGRFTAPSTGSYSVKSLFHHLDFGSGLYPYHFDNGFVIKNGNIAAPLYKSGMPLYKPERWGAWSDYYGVISLNAGDTLDFAAKKTGNNGETQEVIRVQDGSYVVNGIVQDIYGNPLSQAKVVASDGSGGTFEFGANVAYTDASGHYSMTLFEGNYTMTANMPVNSTAGITPVVSPYTAASQTVNVTGPGTFTVPTIQLTPTGNWNAKDNMNWGSNAVNGSWSYGYYDTTTTPVAGDASSFTLLTHTSVNFWSNGWFTVNTNTDDGYYVSNGHTPFVGMFYNLSDTGGRHEDATFYIGAGSASAPTQARRPGVVRFTVPTPGYYSWNGVFSSNLGSNHTVGYDVIANGVVTKSGTIQGGNPSVPFNGFANFPAGGTIDLIVDNRTGDGQVAYLYITAAISQGAPGFQGHVQDNNGVSVSGASVVATSSGSDCPYSTTTDTAGNYTLIAAAGTFTVTASKPGYAPQTFSNVAVGSNLVTENFILANGKIISGNVTENFTPFPVIAGATVKSSDGVYSVTTDSAGNYSLQVTPGTYALTYYKVGHSPKIITVNATSSNVTQNAALDVGFDLASDFNVAGNNPSGPWQYGYYVGTSYTQSAFSSMLSHIVVGSSYWINPNLQYDWFTTLVGTGGSPGPTPGYNNPSFLKNITINPQYGDWESSGHGAYIEPGKVVTQVGGLGNVHSVARFTAPTSGYYHVNIRFSGACYQEGSPEKQSNITNSDGSMSYPVAPPYTNTKVAVMDGGQYVFGGPSDEKKFAGFVGRAANNYTDSLGSGAVVYNYTMDKDITSGEVIDAIVYDNTSYQNVWNWVTNGYTQVDVTFTKDSTTLTGRVLSALPGNPVIAGATVTANGWTTGSTYQTTTDSNGYYVMSVKPDTYDMESKAPGYNTSPYGTTAAVAQNGTAVTNFTLTLSGTWNLAEDYSPLANPCGQWSYGEIWTTTGYNETPVVFGFQPFASFGNVGATGNQIQGWNGVTVYPDRYSPTAFWPGWIGKNTTGAPVSWSRGYVEKDHMTWGAGDNWNGGPAIRWTAPDTRDITINLTLSGQDPTNPSDLYYVSVLNNGVVSTSKTIQGFVGSYAAGYTDSVGPAPVVTWSAVEHVNANDIFDFVIGQAAPGQGDPFLPHMYARAAGLDVSLVIGPPPANLHSVSTINAIKALNQGDTVLLTVPMQLGCATLGAQSFNKIWGNPTSGPGTYWFSVQSDDRAQGIKCITDGTVPTYASNFKVTFSGTVDVQQGQKVVRITSINSALAGTAAKPIGKTGKSLSVAQNGTLVKVWGKVTQMTPNTGSDNDIYQYEYIVINDGSQDVKIPMHCQTNYMAGDLGITQLAIGHMVGITGIAGTTTGSDLVVYPRNVYDLYDYTANGRM